MKKTRQSIALILAVMTAMLAVMTACSGKPTASTVDIAPAKNGLTGRPTVAVPESQMSFNTLMEMNGLDISWKRLSKFDHAVIDEDSALFMVADNYGLECELFVDFDVESDRVVRGDVVYGDLTISILTDDDIVFMQLLRAFEEAHVSMDAAKATTEIATETTTEAVTEPTEIEAVEEAE